MENSYRFEALGILGELDEKYIKEADRYLSERLDADRTVIRLAPERRKFSWKSFAAVAACAAVLISGVAAFISSRRADPIDVTSDPITEEEQAYLDKFKEKTGTSLDVAYAVDRLNFIEIDLPDDVGGNFIDENRAVFIREDEITLQNTLEIYNIKEKTYTTIADLGADGTGWQILYADSRYVIYMGDYSYNFYGTNALYLYDVKVDKSVLIHSGKIQEYEINYSSRPVIADGKIYYSAYQRSSASDHSGYSIHIYDIASGTELEPIKNAYKPMYYKGDILYQVGNDIKSLSGQHDYPNLNSVVYSTQNGLYSQDGWRKVTEIVSGKEIIPSQHVDGSPRMEYCDICDFAILFDYERYDSDRECFAYYETTGEILVFPREYGYMGNVFSEFGWGLFLRKTEPDGTKREFIVTNRESENAVKLPRLNMGAAVIIPNEEPSDIFVLPDTAEFIGDRSFVSFVPAVSVDDAFEFVPLGDGEKDDEIFYGYDSRYSDHEPPAINGHSIKRGDYFDIGHIVRMIALYAQNDYSKNAEWGYYDPETRSYNTLIDCGYYGDGTEFVQISDKYLIFRGSDRCAYLMLEISSIGSEGGLNIIEVGKGLYSTETDYLFGKDGLFYFNAFDADGGNALYSYDFASGNVSGIVPNAVPAFYADELYYIDNCKLSSESLFSEKGRIARGAVSKRAFDLVYSGQILTECGIYGTRYHNINGKSYEIIYNQLTDEYIFGGVYSMDSGIYAENPIGNYIPIQGHNNSDYFYGYYDWINDRVIYDADYGADLIHYQLANGCGIAYSYSEEEGYYDLYQIKPKQ